ncbi:T9SS type B sorting domain-containing protein [Christiangramia echinicola]|uniref:T9SS type B sorting domain-containing protein n=1 Tax=Christiangramia echinicola TaxID=279359 RepID=UPI00040F7E34|nr:T9SS type B sorting domain-containing protein [Christiangramia echinicola]
MRFVSVLIFLLVNINIINAQGGVNDCSGAIKICGDGAISSNANGVGSQELTGRNNCSSQEHNSLWLEIEITKAGTLGFNLKPTSGALNIDYDFFIFGPNASCGNLGNAIRCSTTNPLASNATSNHTGMNDSELDTSEGPGPNGNNFIKSLDVLPGETYFIVIDRPIGNSPFEIEWTGTSTVGSFPFPEGPEISKPGDLEACNSNGVSDFDIFSTSAEIVSQNNTSLTYHESLADASDNQGAIQGTYTSTQALKTIYARVENDLTGCARITEFDLIINDGPIINQDNSIEQCDLDLNGNEYYVLSDLNSSILDGKDPSDFQIQFFSNLNDANTNQNSITSGYSSEGNETVFTKVSEINNPDCFNIAEINLILNEPPQIESYSVVQPQINSNSNTITLDIENVSDYEFSLGNIDGPFQTSTTFNNVNSGFQTIYIRDLKGCAIVSSEIVVLGYDNFFTPNNDGVNDFWKLRGIDTAGNLIHIFDRYGKLLIKLQASDKGWDGTYNGTEMPADDYWFRVSLQNKQEFNGHFSLVR